MVDYQAEAAAAARQYASQPSGSYMLALGGYRFSIETAAFAQMSRDLTFKWPTQARAGSHVAPQFAGRGEFKRRLNGTIYPEYKGGLKQVDAMAAQAGLGKPLQMISGAGEVLGFWCITAIKETATLFHHNGQPRKITFSIELLYYGPNYPER